MLNNLVMCFGYFVLLLTLLGTLNIGCFILYYGSEEKMTITKAEYQRLKEVAGDE